MSEYHPNLDGPAEPIGLAMTAKERREQSELAPATSEATLAAPTGSAKRRSHQCQCCASQLGEPITVERTERVICPSCLGFIARWWIELGNLERQDSPSDKVQP